MLWNTRGAANPLSKWNGDTLYRLNNEINWMEAKIGSIPDFILLLETGHKDTPSAINKNYIMADHPMLPMQTIGDGVAIYID